MQVFLHNKILNSEIKNRTSDEFLKLHFYFRSKAKQCKTPKSEEIQMRTSEGLPYLCDSHKGFALGCKKRQCLYHVRTTVSVQGEYGTKGRWGIKDSYYSVAK